MTTESTSADDATRRDGSRLSEGLGVSEYRERLTDDALQAVENCVQGDMLLTAATVLMFDVRRMRAKIAADSILNKGEAVRIPTSADEAVLMVRLGMHYLREHAPDRLAAETPNVRGEPQPAAPRTTE